MINKFLVAFLICYAFSIDAMVKNTVAGSIALTGSTLGITCYMCSKK